MAEKKKVIFFTVCLSCFLLLFAHNTTETENLTTLEEYVIEMAADTLWETSEMEYIKAQLVLIRTNAYKEQLENQPLYIKRTERTTKEEQTLLSNILFASNATKGIILYKDGKPIEAAYHRVSNGKTRSGHALLGEGYDYLTPTDCFMDLSCEQYQNTQTYTREEWENALKEAGYVSTDLEITKRDASDYVQWIRIGEEIVQGDQFRKDMGIPSADFEITGTSSGVQIISRGIGHGLGLSQHEANELAKKGYRYEEIIKHFFTDITFKKIE